MTTTENYNLKLVGGDDLVNPLVMDNPNYETIDEVMKENADNGIPRATELTTGTVHALTRSNPDASVFHFTATSNFTTGDTFTVDNVQVTALLPSGLPLATGAYIIGSEVICALRDTLLTVFVSGGTAVTAQDSERLGGELPSYYATDSDMTSAENSINALGILTNSLDGRVQALENAGTGLKPTVLWNNPNPAQAFAEQDITLSDDISNYDYYQIIFVLSAAYSDTVVCGWITPIQYKIYAESNRNGVMNARTTAVPNQNTIHIYTSYYKPTYGGSNNADDAYLIPVKVIGFKL